MHRALIAAMMVAVPIASFAGGPNVCAIVPASAVAAIVHLPLAGTHSDVSEEAHAYGCSYGVTTPHVSINVIRPGGKAAFEATRRRLAKAVAVAGIGDSAVYDTEEGLIALFGDTAVSAYVPPTIGSNEQRLAIEKQLAAAIKSRL